MNTSGTNREINEYANIAYRILNRDTNYIRSKKIISDIFKINRTDRFETIIFRLTIIDSYYSTQMNKRLFGLDHLADELSKITKDDKTLQTMCLEFIENPTINNEIMKLFNGKYGIRKTGHDAGQAASLISKYLYFLTEYKFPIYDNLVKISYSLIKSNYPELNINDLNNRFDISYFENIKQLNLVTQIEDYNILDNFLWLIGKLTEGSLSLILNKDRYWKLISKINILQEKRSKEVNSKEVDRLIREYIQQNIDKLTDLFEANEVKFLKYSYELARKKTELVVTGV